MKRIKLDKNNERKINNRLKYIRHIYTRHLNTSEKKAIEIDNV